MRDEEGNAVYAAYNTGERTVTQLSAVSKVQTTTVNIMGNHSFERDDIWSLSSGACYDGGKRHTGKRSLKLTSTSGNQASAAMGQALEQGETYTLSCYFSGSGAGKLEVTSGATLLGESEAIEVSGTAGEDWYRGSVTFSPISSGATISITMPEGTAGTVYADSVMLEKGETPNRYNLLENGDFSQGRWYFEESGNIGSGDGIVTDTSGSHPSGLSDRVYKITGNAEQQKWIYQTIPAAGEKGDTYSFGGWLKSDSIARNTQSYNNRTYGIKRISVEFLNASGSNVGAASMVYFGADTDEWQYGCGTAIAPAAYTQIRVSANFHYTRNTAYYDGLQLYREEFSQAYTYDGEGNLTGYKSLIGQEDKYEYDSSGNVTKATDARGNASTYTYDGKHNQLTATSAEGVVTSNTYNTNGQVTESRVGDSGTYIRSSTQYEQQSGNVIQVTDAKGKSISYGFNESTRQNTSVTDAEGNTTAYTYGNAAEMLRLSGISAPELAAVEYAYDGNGKLSGIRRGETEYGFEYDAWGRTTRTRVGGIGLSENAYDTYGRLSTVTYGNGYRTRYIYDELDRVVRIKTQAGAGEITAYEYIYNGEGDLYELRNYKTNRATVFEYDHSGRCMSTTVKAFEVRNGKISYTGTEGGYRYEYDPNNNLSRIKQSVNGEEWSVTYTYDKDNRAKTTRLDNGKVITNNYDGIGRVTSRTLGLNTTYTTQLQYESGANGSQTAMLSSYKNGDDLTCTYSYDKNGNIFHIMYGRTLFNYEYDGANQLVRENLFIETPEESRTVTYEYDENGNLLRKKTYPLSTGELGEATSTIEYGYSDGDWQDQLISYNGKSITYDSMGNPVNYMGNTLTWEGKQLTGYTKPGKVVAGPKVMTYTYDENGLRQTKTADSVTTRYYYNGSALMGQSDGTDTLEFSYDGNGNAVSVKYNGTYYYYLYNGQGDVVKLIDGDGVTQVEYTYDTWGACSVTGSLANTLGAKNPFRYRGYVYDTETRLYYLESRYYDPETGRFISADVYLTTGQSVIGHNAYAYCGNNPVVREDIGGNFWIAIGAAIGGLISGGLELGSQLLSGKSLTEVNWSKVGVAALSGAVSGAVASTGIGLIGQIGINAGIGAATYVADSYVSGEEITVEGIILNGVAGGISGAIGGKGANSKALTMAWNNAQKGISRELRRANVKYATKQIARYTATKMAIKKSAAVTISRFLLGGLASRRFVNIW